MKPIISPWIIYLINTISNFKTFLSTLLLILGCTAIMFFIAYIIYLTDYEDGDEKLFAKIKKYLKTSLIWLVIASLVYVALPSKDTMYTMLVLDNVTSDNIQAIGKTGKDVVDYITDQIDKVVNDKDKEKEED